jgi:hypothetical protein
MAQSDEVVGTEFTVSFGTPAVEYPFNKVDLKFSGKPVSRSNSKYDPEFETSKIGRKKCTLTLEGPYREGEVLLSVGDEVEVLYKPSATHVGVSFTALITDIAHSNDGDDGPRMTVDLINQSAFTPSIAATARARRAGRRAPAPSGAETPPRPTGEPPAPSAGVSPPTMKGGPSA